MLRSFLARSHPLLSRLRRHDRRLVAKLGHRADGILIQARGYSYTSPSEDETDSDVDRPDQANRHTRKHLYMVLDDWNKGFSIHKLDLDEGEGSDMGGDLTLRPPVHRQATGNRCWNFAAAGRVMQSNKDDYVTLVYDTGAAGLSIVPRVPEPLHDGWALATAAAAGNRLYTFDKISFLDGKYNGGMHILEDAPAPAHDEFWWGNTDHWSWIRVPTPPPFRVDNVESVTMHPAEGGGRTLFVSVAEWNSAVLDIDGNILDDDDNRHELDQWKDTSHEERLMRTTETFSYDTKTREWKRHGHWDLPFHGQAYYDAELDAWVGLRKVYDQPHHHWTTDGYLCSCDVASPDGSPEQPARKLCAEGLFDPYTCPTDVDVSLLYMGGSNYCLVQVMACESFKTKHYTNHVGRKCVIRVTTFRLKYGKKGELIVTARRPDRSFHFSGFFETPKAHAFWM